MSRFGFRCLLSVGIVNVPHQQCWGALCHSVIVDVSLGFVLVEVISNILVKHCKVL